ncbi:hypothetical protein ACLOJK_008113 [Asimina triloba]
MLDKDLVSWNAMLFGLGLHGQAKEALKLFDHMAALKVKPDKVTIIGLLMACGPSGLVEEGWMLFESMESVHGLAHGADHVSCTVDMLGRGKYLEEATKLVSKSSMLSPNAKHFETLLGACSFHGDVAIGSKMAEELTAMDPFKDAGHVLLSNLYCASGHWKEAERVRMAMSAKGMRKVPGCSWIEVRNAITIFAAEVSRIADSLLVEEKPTAKAAIEAHDMEGDVHSENQDISKGKSYEIAATEACSK